MIHTINHTDMMTIKMMNLFIPFLKYTMNLIHFSGEFGLKSTESVSESTESVNLLIFLF